MSKQQPKFYVVWHGVEPGVYSSWSECEQQVKGFEGAVYKSFKTEEEALDAFTSSPSLYLTPRAPKTEARTPKADVPAPMKNNQPVNPPSNRTDTVLPLPLEVTADALAVDAACSGNPGPMEYRGVYLKTGQEVFHFGPVHGTNNIGEFLAIVHAMALLKKKGVKLTIYSDSRNAMLWVKHKKCKTQLARTPRTEKLFDMIARAEKWLHENTSDCPLLKWQTQDWGEVPADFGRK